MANLQKSQWSSEILPLHDKAFWGISFFILGSLIAGLLAGEIHRAFFIFSLLGIFFGFLWMLHKRTLAFLSIFIIIGAGYYNIYDVIQKNIIIPFGSNAVVTGVVKDVATGESRQTITVSLYKPYKGRIRVTAKKYPEYIYGEVVTLEGSISKPPERASHYFDKERIYGVMSYPEVTHVREGEGFYIKKILLSVKRFAGESFKKVLPHNLAIFLTGLLLGETAEFSGEFKEAMSLTGTSHLVALSGYNVTIIAKSIIVLLGMWLSRRSTFIASSIAISAFVMMTGADVTVIRASIMAFLVLLASQSERGYSMRNAISVAAWIMILCNPKILLWDVGFQLSFIALLGLIYVKPALTKILRLSHNPGVLGWRENLLTTLSAQIAVLPILFMTFGIFSPISLVTNVLILTAIPITMLFGFLITVTSLISGYFALLFGLLARIFLEYEVGIISFFSKISIATWEGSFGLIASTIYYAVLLSLVVYMRDKKTYAQDF